MSAPAIPLLAFGPPGWVAFAVVSVGTLAVGGVLLYENSKSKARDDADAIPKEDCPNAKRPWSVRVQAQGMDIGGTSGSTIGAPPIVQTSGPIASAEGVALATATYAMLTSRQQKVRTLAYGKCCAFIRTCSGFLGKKTFQDVLAGSNRFDVDSFGPSPNFVR